VTAATNPRSIWCAGDMQTMASAGPRALSHQNDGLYDLTELAWTRRGFLGVCADSGMIRMSSALPCERPPP